MAIAKPLTPQEWFAQSQYSNPDEDPLDARQMRRAFYGSEDDITGSYQDYLNQYNTELFAPINDPYGNKWVAANSQFSFGRDSEDDPYSLRGGEEALQSEFDVGPYADLIQGLHFTNDKGISYIPEVIQRQINQRTASDHGWFQNWLNGPGPVMLIGSLFTGGALSGFGAAGSAAASGAAEGGIVTSGAGAAGMSAADAAGLVQMGLDAGLPAGSTALDAFVASGGTMGSTAAGGLGGAASLAESFGYAPVTAEVASGAATPWWEMAKAVGKGLVSNATSVFGPPNPQPLDLGLGGQETVTPDEVQPDLPEQVAGGDVALPDQTPDAVAQAPALEDAPIGSASGGAATGGTAIAPAATGAVPAIQDVAAPAAPKPGAPDYRTLWQNYAGWIDNVNRINEGAFSDVRARLSAAGAAPDLIKMQTEHLESQRQETIGEFNKSETYGLLDEGYKIATGSLANRYEGGLSPYAGPGKPELMDFYTELYGAPVRKPGAGGTVGTGGTPGASSSSGVSNPWLDDSSRVSLLG